MIFKRVTFALALSLLALTLGTPAQDTWSDRSPHTQGFATVNGVKLHYLDWGGKGKVLLLLTGASNSAHIYDDIAPAFTRKFHGTDH